MARARTGDHVKVHLTGKLDDGTIFASSGDGEPLEFMLGISEMLPAIDDAVEGMEPGQTRTVHVSADRAFGPWREDLVQEIPRDTLPEDMDVEVGQQLVVEQPGAAPAVVSVTDVSDSTVTLDGNHPLAGQDLTFDLHLVDVS